MITTEAYTEMQDIFTDHLNHEPLTSELILEIYFKRPEH